MHAPTCTHAPCTQAQAPTPGGHTRAAHTATLLALDTGDADISATGIVSGPHTDAEAALHHADGGRITSRHASNAVPLLPGVPGGTGQDDGAAGGSLQQQQKQQQASRILQHGVPLAGQQQHPPQHPPQQQQRPQQQELGGMAHVVGSTEEQRLQEQPAGTTAYPFSALSVSASSEHGSAGDCSW